ncbi:chemokine (C-X-C motif) ligand 18b [Chanos chanos]|uniref:Chemokine (C-X-C motif) ligand 18b n=1 Tax=Chanos chanos TaxID=29144 RepID=A0A6J2VRV0_CHACN|nr:C-X-C motif chemokine 3-like [Chanos chanos]
MAFALKALCLVALAAVFCQSSEAFLPGRCSCVDTIPFVPRNLMAEFSVIPPQSLCTKTNIIAKLTDGKRTCLDPESKQGKVLQQCWARCSIERSLSDPDEIAPPLLQIQMSNLQPSQRQHCHFSTSPWGLRICDYFQGAQGE